MRGLVRVRQSGKWNHHVAACGVCAIASVWVTHVGEQQEICTSIRIPSDLSTNMRMKMRDVLLLKVHLLHMTSTRTTLSTISYESTARQNIGKFI